MDWFIRFTLGLPARPEDAAALMKVLPELKRPDFRLQHRHYFWPIMPEFDTNESLVKALRRWIADVEVVDDLKSFDDHKCPSNNCPLRNEQINTNKDDELFLTAFMVAAGGPEAKTPINAFLDLVRKTHSEKDPPKDIILTDPYIYTNVGEDGHEGGFSNLVAYLKALGISTHDSFSLLMTPEPKKGGSKTVMDALHAKLKEQFNNMVIKCHSKKLKFHDRFYVVRHQSGTIKGVFGPSINGLTSNSIVLMGNIEGPQAEKKLKEWFG